MFGENREAANAYQLVPISEFRGGRERYAHLHRWGPWLLDAQRIVLCRCPNHDDPLRAKYEVDIERVETAQDLLFWISHIAEKAWGDALTVGHLAIAMDALFRPRTLLLDGQRPVARDILKLTIERNWG
ncbi:MAG: hypothetical protein C0494_12575 [Sphingobium sp.]|nr:hypothetical protein [Sphingobium sp.]